MIDFLRIVVYVLLVAAILLAPMVLLYQFLRHGMASPFRPFTKDGDQ